MPPIKRMPPTTPMLTMAKVTTPMPKPTATKTAITQMTKRI